MKEAEKQQKKVNFFRRYISHAFVVGVIHRIHPKAGTEDLLGEKRMTFSGRAESCGKGTPCRSI